jgi:hypothetical protein
VRFVTTVQIRKKCERYFIYIDFGISFLRLLARMAVLANLLCDQDGSMLTIGDIRQFGLAVLRVDTRPAEPSIRNIARYSR